jgi:hypothetical protein
MLERFEAIMDFKPDPIVNPAINYVEGDIWLHVTSGTKKNPLAGDIYVVVNKTWVKETNQYVSGSKETFLFQTKNNYTGSKQVLSTPFLFYFGLRPDKTSLDTLIKYYGPKGAFPSTDFCLDVITPIPTLTPTPTPTLTPTLTPTPTPTKSVFDVEPGYYYYAMGDCNDLRYAYSAYTHNPFGPIIGPIGGCETLANIGTMAMANITSTSYVLSEPLRRCGFCDSYVSIISARSSTSITQNSIYNIGGKCLVAIGVETQYVTSWTVNLDGQTSVGTGEAACRSCDPPFT